MLDIQSLTDEIQRLSQSIAWWNKWVIVGMTATAIAASFLVIAQLMVNKDSKVLSDTQERLIKLKDEKVADELSSKGVLIAKANERAANAEMRAAEANQIAEGERLARVKIEERLAPRSLTARQIASLAERLKPYAGISIDILQIGESPEITHFRSLIETPLRKAGLRPLSSTAVGSGSFIGVSVGILVGASDPEKMAAAAILAALNAEGITTQNAGTVKREDWPGFVMAPTGETSNKAPIRIYVGSKP